MCGRYEIDGENGLPEIKIYMGQSQVKTAIEVKSGEICPTDLAPVLCRDERGVSVHPMRWGFPRFNGGGVVFNARIETVLDKRLFRSSALMRRCVVPATGFYEWKRREGRPKKTKYFFATAEEGVVYMAGIFNHYQTKEGKVEARFCILTTQANASVQETHDRMPVVLRREEMARWLADPLDLPAFADRSGVGLKREAVMGEQVQLGLGLF